MTEYCQGFLVVDDSYGKVDAEHGTGYTGRNYDEHPMHGLGPASANMGEPLISEKDLRDYWIPTKTREKSWPSDHCDRVGSIVKNQANSNYCWIHAPVRGMEVHYVLMGGKKFTLSAFYPGAQIKGGRNQGGSGIVGVEWLVKNGTCVEDFHPPMDFSYRNPSEEKVKNALLHQITSYVECDPRNHQEIWTRLCYNKPVTVGIPDWGHEVLLTFMIWDSAAGPLFGFDNSWDRTWGTNGRGVLRGRKSIFDEAGSIESVEASAS